MRISHPSLYQLFLIGLLAASVAGCGSNADQASQPQPSVSPTATATISPAIPDTATTTTTDKAALPSNQDLEPLTTANAQRLSLLARFGEGNFGNTMALSPDGKTLAVAAQGGVVLYDALDGEKLDFYATSNAVDDLVFSADGRKLAYIVRVPSGDRYSSGEFAGEEVLKPELTLRNTQTGAILSVTPLFGKGCGEYAAHDISFTSDGNRLVFRDTFSHLGLPSTNALCVIAASDGSLVQRIEPEAPLQLTAVMPPVAGDQAVWVSASDVGTDENAIQSSRLLHYNLDSGALEDRIDIQGRILCLSPQNLWLAVSDSQQIQLLSIEDGSVIGTIPIIPSEISTALFSPDGKMLALAHRDGSVDLYRVPQGQLIDEFKPLDSRSVNVVNDPFSVQALRFSPDGTRLYRLLNSDIHNASTFVQAISLDDDQERFTISGRNPFSRPALSADNAFLAWGGYENGDVEVWSTANGEPAFKLKGHTAIVVQTLFSPGGGQIATASNDGTVRLWESGDGKALFTLGNHPGGVWAIAYSNDGSQLASVSRDGVLSLWNTTNDTLIRSFDSGTAGWQVNELTFSPGENTIMIMSGCRTVQLCSAQGAGDLRSVDLSTGQVTTLLPYGIESLEFSQDRTSFGADSLQGELIGQIDAGHFQVLRSFTSPYGNGGLSGAALSPDGRLFLSGNAYGVHLWDANSGQMIGLAQDLSWIGNYGTMQFTADGRIVLIAGHDGVIYLWGVRRQ